jgi:hypothetical protein
MTMVKVVGFTGTREGMSYKQAMTLARLMRDSGIVQFHHGDCVGADEEAHRIVEAEPRPSHHDFHVIVHPPEKSNLRAHCKPVLGAILEPLPYHKRNRAIVEASDLVVGAILHEAETGGTWQTIKYARKQGKYVIVLRPDGSAQHEHVSGHAYVEPFGWD